MKNIRVHARMHQEVLIADGKLFLIECITEDDALIFRFQNKLTDFYNSKNIPAEEWNASINLVPIIVSKTEKIGKGDPYVYFKNSTICYADFLDVNNLETLEGLRQAGYISKILALREQFSPEHIQAIVNGNLKDGDEVLIECEYKEIDCPDGIDGCEVFHQASFIKFTPTNHVIFHGENEMYTLDQMLDFITTFNMSTSYKSVEEAKTECPKLFASKRAVAKEWLEQYGK